MKLKSVHNYISDTHKLAFGAVAEVYTRHELWEYIGDVTSEILWSRLICVIVPKIKDDGWFSNPSNTR